MSTNVEGQSAAAKREEPHSSAALTLDRPLSCASGRNSLRGAATTVSLSESYQEGYKGSGGYTAELSISGDDGPNTITATVEGGAAAR